MLHRTMLLNGIIPTMVVSKNQTIRRYNNTRTKTSKTNNSISQCFSTRIIQLFR